MGFDFSKEPGRTLLNRKLNHEREPLVSIITPFFNADKFFEQTYNCVINQTFPWFEWIIVDDGSTDIASIEILEHFVRMDPRIRLLRQDNVGPAAARNRAAAEAKAEIIIFLDADDLIEPTYSETLFWALYTNPDCAWAYSNSIGFYAQRYVWNISFSAEKLLRENFLNNSAAIRKSVFLAVNGFDEQPRLMHEDWAFWIKLLAAGHKPVKTADFGFWYRRLDSGRMSQVNENTQAQEQTARRIASLSDGLDRSLSAKEYPCPGKAECYSAPKVSDWERKLFRTHDKLHVLLLLPWMEMGGADAFILDVCARLDKSRFELGIITTQQSENTWQQRFAEHVTDIFNLPEFLDIEDWAEFISYYIKSREVDALFLSNSYFGYYLLPWLRKEFPDLAILDYVHMEEWYWRAGGYARTAGAMGDILEKTLVCNGRTRQVLIRDFGRAPESVETLYIGVDAEKYDPARVLAGLAKVRLGIDPSRPMILFPCRIHPQKRPFLMLEIAKRLPELAFAVVGDGPELDALRDAVKRAGLEKTVFFAGRQDDMLPWYKDAALTLICSLKEGVALTAYESLSMGVPLVSSDVGGQAELIDKRVGRVVPLLQDEATDIENRAYSEEEIELYADAIRELLSDETAYDEMRTDCREHILSHFSSELMIRRLEELLTELTQDPHARFARQEASRALKKMESFVDDAFSNYLRLEAKTQEAEDIWQGREWFRKLYEQEKARAEAGHVVPTVPSDATQAQQTLDWIYHMRSWRLVQAYCRFMDETRLGRILCRIREIFRKK